MQITHKPRINNFERVYFLEPTTYDKNYNDRNDKKNKIDYGFSEQTRNGLSSECKAT